MCRLMALCLWMSAALLLAADQNVAGVDLLEDAKLEFQSGRNDAALAILDELDKRQGSDAPALDLRGCVYLGQEKIDQAIEAFRAAHEKDPALYAPRLHWGDALMRQQKWSEARELYQAVMKGTNILILNERLRYAVLMSYLGAKDEAGARTPFENVIFPTETPAYYYAQAAWAFAHGNGKAGAKWMRTADEIFDAKKTAWFARPLYDLGWIKTKPVPVCD